MAQRVNPGEIQVAVGLVLPIRLDYSIGHIKGRNRHLVIIPAQRSHHT